MSLGVGVLIWSVELSICNSWYPSLNSPPPIKKKKQRDWVQLRLNPVMHVWVFGVVDLKLMPIFVKGFYVCRVLPSLMYSTLPCDNLRDWLVLCIFIFFLIHFVHIYIVNNSIYLFILYGYARAYIWVYYKSKFYQFYMSLVIL